MRKANAIHEFAMMVLVANHRYDYWAAQELWSAYTDALCKDGRITDEQWNSWSTPFPYGAHVTVNDKGRMVFD